MFVVYLKPKNATELRWLLRSKINKPRRRVELNHYLHKLRMPVITLTTTIAALVETVFDLSRSIDLHIESTSKTKERAIAGKMHGLIELGETVTWEVTHVFVRQRLTVRVTESSRPNFFPSSGLSPRHGRHAYFACRCGRELETSV